MFIAREGSVKLKEAEKVHLKEIFKESAYNKKV